MAVRGGQVEDDPLPGPEPYGDAAGGPSPGTEHDPCLSRPPVHRAVVRPGPRNRQFGIRRDPAADGRPVGPGPDPQLPGPAPVPQVTVQIQAEPPVGTGVGMTACAVAGAGRVPQGEADPLTGVRPGGRGPDHEGHRRGAVVFRPVVPRAVVPGQGHGQSRAQEPVGSDARHVPAQQVRCQVTQIGPDAGRECPAVGT